MEQCFVCDKQLQRCDINNEFSREDFAVTVSKIIGDDYLLIVGEEDHLCQACQNLLLRIVRLEVEEKTNTLEMRVLLQMKYSLDFSNKGSDDGSREPCRKTLQLDHEMEHCFVCDKLLQSSDFNTDYSRNDLINIIRKIVGDGYFMVIKEEDHLCQACQDLMSTIQSKGAELRTMTLAMRALLRIKYSLDFQNVGMLGSSLEGASASLLMRPVTSFEDISTSSLKRPAKKVCPTKSAVKRNSRRSDKSKKDINSSNLTPSKDISTPKEDVLKAIKNSLGVTLSKNVLSNLNSTHFVSNDIDIDLSFEKKTIQESLSSAVQNYSQPETANQNSTSLLQDGSQQENCASECENKHVNSESVTKFGFHKSCSRKCLKHKISKPYKCGRCKFKYSTTAELEAHNLEMKSKKPYYCKICDFNFHLKNLINQHMSNHSPVDLKRQCKLCNQPIYDRLHLRYHFYTIHRGEEGHNCSYCNRSFLWKRQLTKHLYKFHEEKPAFTCDKCKKVYADKVKYLKHVEYFHRKSHSCKICFKSFKDINSLCLHEKSHKSIPTYKCQYCFKKYRTLENRRLHEEQHSGNFEHTCDNCGLGFQELSWFENHKAKNTCARSLYGYIHHPTMCEICGKIFSNRITFKNHHLLHYNPHPFECDICFKKLRYKTKLYYHRKRYHPETLASTSLNKSV